MHSPFRIKDRVFNVGNQSCTMQSTPLNPKGLFTVQAGEIFERELITSKPPKLVGEELSVGAINTPLKSVPIRIYVEQ
jgi:hypothetical protein